MVHSMLGHHKCCGRKKHTKTWEARTQMGDRNPEQSGPH